MLATWSLISFATCGSSGFREGANAVRQVRYGPVDLVVIGKHFVHDAHIGAESAIGLRKRWSRDCCGGDGRR
jgi:2,4-dienoyl-CoA reductase-like NADH-dependent reductase (Old Yellow Enzyme family)